MGVFPHTLLLPAHPGDPNTRVLCHAAVMTHTSETLKSLSNALADAVDAVSASVVQVRGARRPVSGLVYSPEVVLTAMSALGRDNGIQVRRGDGTLLPAELVGWDPATNVAVLRVSGLSAVPAAVASAAPRVGHVALAIARSWSNAVTASTGIISVIGGPLHTGRRRSIEQVIRTNAPMHDGFTGGAFIDTDGGLLGMTTPITIRGSAVVIPAAIVWSTAAAVLEHGSIKRGYLGISGHRVHVPEAQRAGERETALLIVGVVPGGPAEAAGVLVGDILAAIDDQPLDSPEDLLDLMTGIPPGRVVRLRVNRGGGFIDVSMTAGERPTR